MDGGAPAGMNTRPGEVGCRKNRTHIKIVTRPGKRSTRPRGIEIVEFPFRRIRLRNKPEGSRGVILSAFSDQPLIRGNGGGDGIRFVRFCTKPMWVGYASRARQPLIRVQGFHPQSYIPTVSCLGMVLICWRGVNGQPVPEPLSAKWRLRED